MRTTAVQFHPSSLGYASRPHVMRAASWVAVAATAFALTASLSAAPQQQGIAVPPDALSEPALQVQTGSAAAPASPVTPVTGKQRVKWIVRSTIGPESLAGGVWSAGIGSWANKPPEYGRGWDGFAKRYGMRLTGVSVGNTIEGSLGAIWGEDPRYPRSGKGSFWQRLGHSAKMTFAAPYPDGKVRPSYARYIGNVGNNFLSNTWRVDSQATTRDAWRRVGFGTLGRFTGNVFEEFWPSVMAKLRGPKK